MPLYVKSHSQGEYIFDHGWAEAYERAGGRYYPKLQVAVPFTPVPGRRFLGPPEHRAALASAAIGLTRSNGLSSLHITFCTDDEATALDGHDGADAPRHPAIPLAEPRLQQLRRFPCPTSPAASAR